MVYSPQTKGGEMLSLDTIAREVGEAAACFPVKKVSLFGSQASGTATAGSDVDLLVEFTSAAVSLITISALRQQIEEGLGVSVDLVHAPLPEGSLLDVGKTVTVYER